MGEVIISSGKPIDGENEVKTVKHSSIFTNAIKKNNEVKEVKFFETQSAVNNDSHSNSDNNEKNKNDKLSENSKIVSTKNAIEYGKEVAASVEDEDYDDEEESGSKSTKRAPK